MNSPTPNNLVVQRSPLVGRGRELVEARDLLLDEDTGLLTFTGPAGTGKTRLATHLAGQLLDRFPEGVYFVALAAVRDPALVPPTIAQTLSIRETEGTPVLDTLEDFLRNKRLLLVLDNFEQVVEAGPLVAGMLATCPRLKILATSRQPLRLREEQEFPVPPLSLPDRKLQLTTELLSQYEAVQLFIQRATDIKPDFKATNDNAPAIAEICYRLDGLPLAIELAAARINLLSPQMILGRLQNRLRLLTGGARDLPARQQTMRNTIEWSYDLLEDSERELFRRLSIFVGGCTIEATEAVLTRQDDPKSKIQNPKYDVLEGLGSLVDKSLLVQHEQWDGNPRFDMLGTIRDYGLEKLAESGEEEAMGRSHALYFLGVAEEAESGLQGSGQSEWLNRLETEHDNLRAALQWSLARPGDEDAGQIGVRMGGAVWRFWYMRGYFTEGRRWLDDLRALPGAVPRTQARARLLNGAANLAYNQGDYRAAHEMHSESLAISRDLGDKKGVAASLNNLGLIARYRGDPEQALALFREALDINRETGNRSWEAINLSNMGSIIHEQGKHAEARPMLEQSLTLFSRLGNRWGMAMALRDLGASASALGDYPAARDLYERSMALQADVGDRRGVGLTLVSLGHVVYNQGDYAAARAFYQQALTVLREIGDKRGIASALEGLGNAASYTGEYAAARAHYEEALAIREEVGYKRGIGSAHNNLGLVALQQGDFTRAITCFDRSLPCWREVGDRVNEGTVLNNLGRAWMGKGDIDRAETLLKEGLQVSEEAGNKWAKAYSLSGLAQLALRRGDPGEAGSLFQESLTLRQALGDRRTITRTLVGLAGVASAQGQHARVAMLLGAAEAQMEAIGIRLDPVHRVDYERGVMEARVQLGEAAFEAAWKRGRSLSLEEAVQYGLKG